MRITGLLSLLKKATITVGTTFGATSGFNIRLSPMSGGGYYAVLYDGNTAIYQRQNAAGGTDITLGGTGKLNRFTSYSYNRITRTLTLTGAIDAVSGVTYTRKETYKFIAPYVVENTFTVSANGIGTVVFDNFNYYLQAVNAIWDINNTNLGNNTTVKPLGIGVQLAANGPLYGCIADNDINNQNSLSKESRTAVSGIKVTSVNFNTTGSNSIAQKQWFYKSTNTSSDFILEGELAVAAAKNFSGAQWDKVCQVTAYLNQMYMTDLTTYKLIPSQNYNQPAGHDGMWQRDSFWQSFLVSNTVEQTIITNFENAQNGSGQIPTSFDQNKNASFNHDESTMLYIIRAYYDKTVRKLNVQNAVLTKALTFINNQASAAGKYQNNAGASNSWIDQYTSVANECMGYNQGLYCVALKCAQALGLSVTNGQIANAVTAYQSLYNPAATFITFSDSAGFLAPDVLVGEALSIFLFGTQLLTDTMVNNHVAKLQAVSNTIYGVKNICNADGSYLVPNFFATQYVKGDYQNGGSWFLYEYLAYYAAKNHNNSNAATYIANRKTTEMNVSPVSHEYLQTSNSLSTPGDEDGVRHAYSWNAASYVIK